MGNKNTGARGGKSHEDGDDAYEGQDPQSNAIIEDTDMNNVNEMTQTEAHQLERLHRDQSRSPSPDEPHPPLHLTQSGRLFERCSSKDL